MYFTCCRVWSRCTCARGCFWFVFVLLLMLGENSRGGSSDVRSYTLALNAHFRLWLGFQVVVRQIGQHHLPPVGVSGFCGRKLRESKSLVADARIEHIETTTHTIIHPTIL
jgi:hypothetical protein